MSIVPPYGVVVGPVDSVPPQNAGSDSLFEPATVSAPELPTSVTSFALPNNHLGPFLTYRSFSHKDSIWIGSILFVTATSVDPTLKLVDAETGGLHTPAPQVIATFANVVFSRFDLRLPVRRGTGYVKFEYKVEFGAEILQNEFYVPAGDERNWNWTHFSCAGFSTDVEPERRNALGRFTVWADLLREHKDVATPPIVLNVGGGDQVYADDVIRLPMFKDWLEMKGKENRMNAPWTSEHEGEVTRFYLDLYAREYSHPIMSEIVASIPLVCVADDHDIVDGFGSYPAYIQRSNMFKNLGRIALTFIALFQHQTNPSLAPTDGFFTPPFPTQTGVPAYHHIRTLGPQTLLAALDTRTERTPTQVFSPSSIDQIISNLTTQITPSVKHIIVLTGVPLVYARLDAMDSAAEMLGTVKASVNAFTNSFQRFVGSVYEQFGGSAESAQAPFKGLKAAVGKTGLMSSILNHFGEVELQDDLMDHWTHGNHVNERTTLIHRFQQLTRDHRVRVTFVGGDVHVGGTGYLFSDDPSATPESDPRLMYQIISSAIVNVPPPSAVGAIVDRLARSVVRVDERTLETMHPLFDDDGRIVLSRNWCIVRGTDENSALRFEIRAEVVSDAANAEGGGAVDVVAGTTFAAYSINVPALL